MTRAAIYARYSSDRQSEASCEDQIRECRRFAEAKGWTVAEAVVVSEESVSGASRHNRPGLLELVADAGRAFDVLVVFDVSRLGRNDEDVAWVRNRLEARGVRCVEAANGDDLASLSSRVRGLLAAEYRQELGRHTRRGLRGQFERGYVPGAAPYGYRLVADPEVRDPSRKCKRLLIHEAEAEIVRRIFEASAAGQGAKQIARRLNAEGAPAPKPRASKVRPSWSPTSIHALLGNRIYRGDLVWGRTRWLKDHDTGRRRCFDVPEADWLRREAPELRIVDDILWHSANQARRRRGRRIVRDESGQLRRLPNRGAPGRHMRCSSAATAARPSVPSIATAGDATGRRSGVSARAVGWSPGRRSRAPSSRESWRSCTPRPSRPRRRWPRPRCRGSWRTGMPRSGSRPSSRESRAGWPAWWDVAADGDMAAALVRSKLADLEAERARLRVDLAEAEAEVPEPGAVADAIHRALSDVSALLRGDPQGAREALRALLGNEPLRVVASEDGYRLEGAVDLIPATPGKEPQGPPVVQVAGAGFEPATCGL